MMRGYQKRIVYLKNTGSDIFEEAYFVINENHDKKRGFVRAEAPLIDEATRIIEENVNFGKKIKPFRVNLKSVFFFGAGLLIEAAILITVLLLIKKF